MANIGEPQKVKARNLKHRKRKRTKQSTLFQFAFCKNSIIESPPPKKRRIEVIPAPKPVHVSESPSSEVTPEEQQQSDEEAGKIALLLEEIERNEFKMAALLMKKSCWTAYSFHQLLNRCHGCSITKCANATTAIFRCTVCGIDVNGGKAVSIDVHKDPETFHRLKVCLYRHFEGEVHQEIFERKQELEREEWRKRNPPLQFETTPKMKALLERLADESSEIYKRIHGND